MPDETQAWTYRVLRYTPNLVRDEWVNIGVLLYDPAGRRLRARLVEEEGELGRIRRLHPAADQNLLRSLPAHFDAEIVRHADDYAGYLTRLDETLSNVLEVSPRHGLDGEDFDAELERLYQEYVAPPPSRLTRWLESSRGTILKAAREVFTRAGILPQMKRRVPVERFTHKGDPLLLDYGYQRDGTRGFAHALALARDPNQAKALAYTAERVRAELAGCEFTALTEAEPEKENPRHQFVAGLLAEQAIAIVPQVRLADWAGRLRPELRPWAEF
jgi:Protein of unknown function (DUF3037)